jgi:acetate kinase
LPPAARVLPLPRAWASDASLQRFGYHGIAVRSVVERFAAHRPDARRLVAVHLGGGCSVTAVRDGRSIDTSMGFSPLEGMVMATRSGSLDPALVAHLCRKLNAGVDVVARRLSREAGLAGLSGRRGDMREIEALRARGDEAAGLASDVFLRSAKAHLAAAQAALGGADAVLLSGGIGENSEAVRAALLGDAGWCGIALDPEPNAAPTGPLAGISLDGSRVAAYVVGVDEEGVIARATAALLAGDGHGS